MAIVVQDLYFNVDQPAVTWHSEGVLSTPRLTYPQDGEVICPNGVASGEVILTYPTLVWSAVPGAVSYVVQWCLNDSFSGPTLMGDVVNTTYFQFSGAYQIPQGITIYWRVFAIDRAGKVSSKSPSRSFAYDCSSGKGDGSGLGSTENLCQKYGIKLNMEGVDSLKCQDVQNYYIKLFYPCYDPCGNIFITLDNIVWTWFGDQAQDCVITDPMQDNPSYPALRCEVRVNCCDTFEFVLRAQAFFTDHLLGASFSCFDEKKIKIDCQTKTATVDKLPCKVYIPPESDIVYELPEPTINGNELTWLSDKTFIYNPIPDRVSGFENMPAGCDPNFDNLYSGCNEAGWYSQNTLRLGCGLAAELESEFIPWKNDFGFIPKLYVDAPVIDETLWRVLGKDVDGDCFFGLAGGGGGNLCEDIHSLPDASVSLSYLESFSLVEIPIEIEKFGGGHDCYKATLCDIEVLTMTEAGLDPGKHWLKVFTSTNTSATGQPYDTSWTCQWKEVVVPCTCTQPALSPPT